MAEQASRRVLQVAPPGTTGDAGEAFPTVQAAVDAVPLGNKARVIIRLAPGVYREPVYVAKTKNLITMVGASPEASVVSWDNTFKCINNPQPSSAIGTGTFGCGTFIVEGEDFIAENITFENSAPEGSEQAVAVRVTADRCAFYHCRFLGWQDTLYLHHGKQYLRDCYIEGHVDFIFGNSTALMEHCHIHCKAAGYITAHNRKSASESTGFVFLRCSGPGSNLSNRVTWCSQLPDAEAEQFLAHTFIDPELDRPWLLQMMAIRMPASA
ncbi:hypothetical protein BS78_01G248500 [Paspalum vaginatum]|nr:hypothetical protein BS78_01G248500 [Paspalum vaginatum]